MELRDYVRVIRIRWRLIAICVLVGVAAATVATLKTSKVYKSSSQIIVATPGQVSLGEALNANAYIQQRINSYVLFVSSPDVAAAALKSLGRPMSQTRDLSGRTSASSTPNTVLMTITITAPTGLQAQQETDAVAAAFVEKVKDIEPAASGSGLLRVSVVRPANLPGVPTQPRPKTNLLVGLFAGAFVGISLALIRESLDVRVASPDVIEQVFGVPTLAVIAFDETAKANPLINMHHLGSTRAEAYRRLRTNLQFVDLDHGLRSVVLTSSVPGEGKTTTACNLSILLSEAGFDVTLVEGDLRRPRVANYMGLNDAVGLTDVLIGRVPLDDALQTWGSSGRLQVLAAGQLPPNPSEILGSEHMAQLIRELEERSMVIIDAPPLLPVTDAAVLTAHSSGAMLVIRAKSTGRDQIATAVQSLKDVNGKILGAVFNMAPSSGPDAYAYRYGYYYEAPKDHKADRRRRKLNLDEPEALAMDTALREFQRPAEPGRPVEAGVPRADRTD